MKQSKRYMSTHQANLGCAVKESSNGVRVHNNIPSLYLSIKIQRRDNISASATFSNWMFFFQQKYKFVWQHQLSEAPHSEQKKSKHNAMSINPAILVPIWTASL
jgi:hypothetical protein